MNDEMKHSEVNLRKKHPTLYHSIMAFATIQILLGFNYWTSNPTFNPSIIGYVIDKNHVGILFFLFGVLEVLFLNVWRNLPILRFILAFSSGWMMCWGLVNTQQVFNGKASWAFPIVFVGLSSLQMIWTIESPVNRMTEKK